MEMPPSNIVETPKATASPAPAVAPSVAAAPAATVEAPATAHADGAKPPAEEKPQTAREGALLQQVRAKEKANVARDQQLARKEQEIQAREQRVTTQAEQSAARDKAAQADPLEYLRKFHGWTDEQIGARLLNKGAPPPDEARERRIADLEGKIKARDEADAKTAYQAKLDAAVKTFVELRTTNADRWPLAAKVSESRIKSRGLEISKSDSTLSDEDIYDRIEEELSEYASLTKEPAKSKSAPADSPKETPGNATSAPAPTLAGVNTATASPPAKVDVLKMSKAELDEYTVKVIREARARGELRE